MKKLIYFGSLLISSPALSQGVMYTFTAYSSVPGQQIPVSISGGFSVTLAGFITGFTDIPLAQLSSCTVANPGYSCGSTERFYPFLEPGYDVVNFRLTLPNSTVTGPLYYFQDNAFSAYGNYQTIEFGSTQYATLVVSQAGSAVPEVTTWAMMIAGFGLVGASLRRRKTTVHFA